MAVSYRFVISNQSNVIHTRFMRVPCAYTDMHSSYTYEQVADFSILLLTSMETSNKRSNWLPTYRTPLLYIVELTYLGRYSICTNTTPDSPQLLTNTRLDEMSQVWIREETRRGPPGLLKQVGRKCNEWNGEAQICHSPLFPCASDLASEEDSNKENGYDRQVSGIRRH